MKSHLIALSVLICVALANLSAQSVSEAQRIYTGNTSWDASSGIFTITSTGTFDFQNRELLFNNVWTVPSEVEKIVIKEFVTVTGEFYTNHDLTIRGEDQFSSIIYGTPEQDYLGVKEVFVAFSAKSTNDDKVVLRIENLTSLNPKKFHMKGYFPKGVIHLDSSRFIDDRGGRYNNSDGYVSGEGGTVKNCYFRCGDDVIKIYDDITVENTVIEHEFFSVPIQGGWGNGCGNNLTATFKNIAVVGTSGRNPENAFLEARQGNYTKHVNIDELVYLNPNGGMFRVQQPGSTININITNSYIDVARYGNNNVAQGTRTVCGTTDKKSEYKCYTGKLKIITAASNCGGKISPYGITEVDTGSNHTVTIIPFDGFEIQKVIVDGVAKGAISSYSFNDITNFHYVFAHFKESEGTSAGRTQAKNSFKDITIAPNPGSTKIKVSLKSVADAEYSIYTPSGSLAKKGIISKGESKIDISTLQNGVHVLQVYNGSSSVSRKINIWH